MALLAGLVPPLCDAVPSKAKFVDSGGVGGSGGEGLGGGGGDGLLGGGGGLGGGSTV